MGTCGKRSHSAGDPLSVPPPLRSSSLPPAHAAAHGGRQSPARRRPIAVFFGFAERSGLGRGALRTGLGTSPGGLGGTEQGWGETSSLGFSSSSSDFLPSCSGLELAAERNPNHGRKKVVNADIIYCFYVFLQRWSYSRRGERRQRVSEVGESSSSEAGAESVPLGAGAAL